MDAPRPARLWIALAALAALLTFALAEGAVAAKPPKGPSGAKFYDPPKGIPKAQGELIWQRGGRGLAAVEGSGADRLVLYTSRGIGGRTIAVSGSVSVPEGKAPKKGWPVVTYAHGTTGSADSCAPTRIPASSPFGLGVSYVDPLLEDLIDAGYAVVRTDYEGLGTPGPHPYLIGESEGRSVLDIVSAARDLELDIGKRFVIAGHSQGGHAALFAAGLARSYAKGLKLSGIVAYAPASQLAEQTALLPALTEPSPLSGLAALILQGAATASDRVQPAQLLSDAALSLYPDVDSKCIGDLIGMGSFGALAPSELLREGADLEPLKDVLREQNPAVRTAAPILIAQGTADTTVFPVFTDTLNDQLAELGNDLDYRKYEGVGHGEIPLVATDDTLRFFERRLSAGK